MYYATANTRWNNEETVPLRRTKMQKSEQNPWKISKHIFVIPLKVPNF
jgi:hypothetical protein